MLYYSEVFFYNYEIRKKTIEKIRQFGLQDPEIQLVSHGDYVEGLSSFENNYFTKCRWKEKNCLFKQLYGKPISIKPYLIMMGPKLKIYVE